MDGKNIILGVAKDHEYFFKKETNLKKKKKKRSRKRARARSLEN